MKILVLAPNYPHTGHPFSGVFNERSVIALKELCESVEVVVPRPYAPRVVSSCVPRWGMYALTPSFEVRNGIRVHRPAYPQIPKVGGALWIDSLAFLFCRSVARKIHRNAQFDAILSFDLVGGGGLAWRIGADLKIPAAGWATGGDLNFPALSSYRRAVARTLRKLDLVFYQSHELLKKAARLLGRVTSEMSHDRHTVLSRGVSLPPCLSRNEVRLRLRAELGITEEQVLVLNVGRVCREKGAVDLIDAISLAASQDPRITCILVGSHPAFDETIAVQNYLDKVPAMKERVRLLPACSQHKVWEYLCAADIFAFPSSYKGEGMPNSILEAMVMGLPSVAFAIPPVLEIEAGAGGLILVPPLDSRRLAEEILRLAASPDERTRLGEKGKQRVLEGFMVQTNMAEAIRRLATTLNGRMTLNKGQSARME
jgi:teichuronic acid biosynthesis glycosyltransferase TuaC